MRWVNFGGGHLITEKGYDVEHLCRLINDFRDRYPNIEQVYLEPGEAVALNAGILVTTVLDVKSGGEGNVAILDFSPEAHLSDIVVSPFRQEILGAGMPGEHPHDYLLGAPTCSAGDVLGEYSFPKPLKVGDRLILLNMAVYSMVKTSTFCGVRLPDIAIYHPKTGEMEVVRRFGYEDFRNRLS
jgi:carboxynorspermidine decarboxylase